MNIFQLKNKVLKKLEEKRVDFNADFNRDKEMLRVERKDNNKGLNVSLSKAVDKSKKDEKFLDEIVYYIDETLERMKEEEIKSEEAVIYPVIRATSFYDETKEGTPFVKDEHTNETDIYYAIDFKNSYRLIDETLAASLGMKQEDIRTLAENNMKGLKISYNKETIQGNDFYFVNYNDGYDASRILNEAFLDEMYEKCTGEMMVGLPHQDVLIIADARNSVGYDIMAQMMMKYFAEGLTPITSLSFSYREKKLEPVFILGKQKDYNKRGKNDETDV
ncbi:DUF1444 family protein [Salinicoccus albus]|uniref:DUF1444 family protein n=1 Tax=Salinicoccus albus TaxID=418756 RepID=UPI00036BBC1B|nr:DUF1444 family protein [Salinicoccus albus]